MSGQCGAWPSLVCSHDPLPDSGLCRRLPLLHGARGPCREDAPAAPGSGSLTHFPMELVDSPMSSLGRPVPARVWPSPHCHLCSGLCAPRHSSLRPEPWHRDVSRRPVQSTPGRLTHPTAGPRLPESHGPSQVSLCSRRPRLDGGRCFPTNWHWPPNRALLELSLRF